MRSEVGSAVFKNRISAADCLNDSANCWRKVAKSTLFVAVIIDGSFVTSKAVPADADLILVLKPGHDNRADLPMFDYALVSRPRLRRRFSFDVLIAREGSMEYEEFVGFFALVRDKPGKSKGMLRVRL